MSEHQSATADVQQRLPDCLPGNVVDVSVKELAESALNELHIPQLVLEECQPRWDRFFARYSVSSYVTDEEFDATVHNVNMHSYTFNADEHMAVDRSQSRSEKSLGKENGVDYKGDNVTEHLGEESQGAQGTGALAGRNKRKNCQSSGLLGSESVGEHHGDSEKSGMHLGDSVTSGKEDQQAEDEDEEGEGEDIGSETETECEEESTDFLESDKTKFIHNWLQSSSFHTEPPSVTPNSRIADCKPIDDFAREMAIIQHSLNDAEASITDPNLPDLETWQASTLEQKQPEVPTRNIMEEIDDILGGFVPTPISPLNDESTARDDCVFSQLATHDGYHVGRNEEALGFATQNDALQLNVVDVAVAEQAVILDACAESAVAGFETQMASEVICPDAEMLSESTNTRRPTDAAVSAPRECTESASGPGYELLSESTVPVETAPDDFSFAQTWEKLPGFETVKATSLQSDNGSGDKGFRRSRKRLWHTRAKHQSSKFLTAWRPTEKCLELEIVSSDSD